MPRTAQILALMTLIVSAIACQTGTVHEIPTARDYAQLDAVDLDEVAGLVDQARRMGAQHRAPYAYFSAERYLDTAYTELADGDRRGARDFGLLARGMAQAALAAVADASDPGERPMPRDRDGAQAAFDQAKARYLALDREKAILVAPVLYAYASAALSSAEHELKESHRDYPDAIRFLRTAEPHIEAIWTQDTDDDGVTDMKDDAPFDREDFDDFEDEDGAPDPDNDQDGIPDTNDVAPLEPETVNGWRDYDGAPDTAPAIVPIYFASGSATLTSDACAYLRAIAQLLREWPELMVRLSGHTDNAHSEPYNLDLSMRRVLAVQDQLVSDGASADQFIATFHGESEPAADNATEQGRQQNRRVELLFE